MADNDKSKGDDVEVKSAVVTVQAEGFRGHYRSLFFNDAGVAAGVTAEDIKGLKSDFPKLKVKVLDR